MRPISNEIKKYVKYNTGNYSNQFITKKTGLKMVNLLMLQQRLNVKVTNALIGYDYIMGSQASEHLGLTYTRLLSLLKNGIVYNNEVIKIESKKIGKFLCITLEDLEKIEDFLKKYIRTSEVVRILNLKTNETLLYHKAYLTTVKFPKGTYFKKEEIINIKNKLNETVSIKEFSKQSYYSESSIYQMIKGKKLRHEIILGVIRINKSELETIAV